MVDICSNHATAFAAYGVADGSAIVHRTSYRLRSPDDDAVHASSEFMVSLAQAFRRAVHVEAERHTVPTAVDEAIDQAVTVTAHDLLDHGSADLRTHVLPTFYRTVSRTYCALDGPAHDHGPSWYTEVGGGQSVGNRRLSDCDSHVRSRRNGLARARRIGDVTPR